MDRQLKIIYHYHSGFSVQVGGTLLVFDYWEGEGRSLAQVGRITPSFLKAFEKIYVFISHAHPDHLDPIVYTWESEGLPITYVVSSDMPVGTRGKRLAPLQEKELSPDISVKAFQSTDLGVAFLVRAYGMNIFHAGDLNLWHWRQESTLREIEAAENAYYEAIEPIKGERIDVCMFPVDPRQGLMYDAGANHFILTMKPRVFIPMHWQERPEVAIDFARFVTNEKNQIEFDKKASVFPSAKGGLDDDYYKSIDESTLEGKALKITLDQVKDGYGSRPAEFTDNNGYKNFQQQIALAMQGKQTAKEALDKSVEFANEKLAQ